MRAHDATRSLLLLMLLILILVLYNHPFLPRYRMLSGHPPFYSLNIHTLLNDIKVVRYECPETILPAARDLISKLLQHDPEARLSMEDVERHPWLSSGVATAPTLATFEVRQREL